MILSAAVDKQCDVIENDAGETDAAQCCHRIAQGWKYVNGAKHVWQEAEEEQKQRAYYAHGEDHRKEMHELEALWIFLVEIDAGDATVVNLSPELAEVGAALMPYPCFREQTATAACLEDTDREIYVLTETQPASAKPTAKSIIIAFKTFPLYCFIVLFIINYSIYCPIKLNI